MNPLYIPLCTWVLVLPLDQRLVCVPGEGEDDQDDQRAQEAVKDTHRVLEVPQPGRARQVGRQIGRRQVDRQVEGRLIDRQKVGRFLFFRMIYFHE